MKFSFKKSIKFIESKKFLKNSEKFIKVGKVP